MPAPAVTTLRPIIIAQGQVGGIIHWVFQDISDGTVVVPTEPVCRLYDPNGTLRDPTNTANGSAATFSPSFDTTGTITGTVNGAYITIGTMAPTATLGVWVIEVAFTWESVPVTLGVGFNVSVGGATVTGTDQLATVPVYAFYKDVENLLLAVEPFDSNSTAIADKIDNYIVMAEGEFEARTGKAYKPRFETNELLDLDTYRQKRVDSFMNQAFTKRPIRLAHSPILPFDSSRGHKIELYKGSESPLTAGDPIRRWADLAALNYGRSDGDYWFDDMGGGVFIRNTLMVRQGRVLRVTYEWGKPITALTAPAAGQPTTINVGSTYRYEHRGIVRIGRTYIFHTGKTPTSFTGCRWGVLGTQAEDYSAGSEVYEVPQDVRQAVVKKAAAMFLENEVFMAVAGDNAGTAPKFSEKIDRWNEDWENFITKTNQRWLAF